MAISAVERWQAFTGEAARLERDGRTFQHVSAERRAKREPIE